MLSFSPFMKQKLIIGVADSIVRHYWLVSVLLIALAVLCGQSALKLTINSNQIELLDQGLRPIQELQRLTEMTGGTGFLMLALKTTDETHLKAVADDLAARITAMPEVRSVTYKQDISFVRKNIGMYVETKDLETARERIRKKIRQEIRKANPFSIELVERKDEPLNLDDIVEKYRSMAKKEIDDDYYIARDKQMVLLLIKPTGESTDLESTRNLIAKIDADIREYNKANTRAATVLEGYEKNALVPGSTVTYGYTGGYKLNLDDSDTIKASLIPTSIVSLIGIFILLMYFLRRLSFVLILEAGLILGMLYAFGFAYFAVGKLNVITAMLGGILQGLGIDYGVHFLYRLREEYTLTRDLKASIHMTVVHSGPACIATVATTAAAFYILMLSHFKGFSEFGLIAGTGVIIIAINAYVAVPVAFLIIARFWPSFPEKLLPQKGDRTAGEIRELSLRHFPFSRAILVIAVVLTAVLGYFATKTTFNYNARALMVPDQPSILLQEEINDRFKISSDPVGIYAATIEDYEKLYRTLHPTDWRRIDKERFPTADAVVSLFSFLPPREQQDANAKVLELMKKDAAKVKPDSLEPEDRKKFEEYLTYLEAKPFGLDGLPDLYRNQFRAVPEKRAKHPGWLTFIYPHVALWDGRDLLAFDENVEEIQAKDGTKFYSTGMAILFAKLATIVLEDGEKCTIITAILVFVLVFLDFRKLSATLIALLPLIVGIVWMLGLMHVFGTQLNFINITVLPLILGYGIATGIHIYHRFVESGSVMRAIWTTGGAVMASVLTTVVGWGALLVAEHRGLQSMGGLACLGIAGALVVSLTVVPAILQLLVDSKERKLAAAAVPGTPPPPKPLPEPAGERKEGA